MMEVWDAYDQQRKLIAGLTLEREKFPYPEAWYHLAVNVWVQDEAGNWLFMRRAASKSNFHSFMKQGLVVLFYKVKQRKTEPCVN